MSLLLAMKGGIRIFEYSNEAAPSFRGVGATLRVFRGFASSVNGSDYFSLSLKKWTPPFSWLTGNRDRDEVHKEMVTSWRKCAEPFVILKYEVSKENVLKVSYVHEMRANLLIQQKRLSGADYKRHMTI